MTHLSVRTSPILGGALVALVYTGFISIGLPDGLLGVAWPSIRSSFGLAVDALGAFLVMFTAGYLLSSFISGAILGRITVGTLLSLSCLATGVALFGYVLSSSWWLIVAISFLAGLGAGAIDAGLNAFAAENLNARALNWMHASYGVGTASGPVLMTGILERGLSWQWGYGLVAIGQLFLACCFGFTRKLWASGTRRRTSHTSTVVLASMASTLRLPITWLSIAAFVVYTGLEAATGLWVYSLFTEDRSISMATAGMWVSVYWGCLTVGRVIFGIVADSISIERLLRFCTGGIIMGTYLIWMNPNYLMTFLGLALVGLSCAPIFPSLIATTPSRLGESHTANGVGFQIAGAVLGQSLLPAFLGILAKMYGLSMVGPFLFCLSLVLLLCFEALSAIQREGIRIAQETL